MAGAQCLRGRTSTVLSRKGASSGVGWKREFWEWKFDNAQMTERLHLPRSLPRSSRIGTMRQMTRSGPLCGCQDSEGGDRYARTTMSTSSRSICCCMLELRHHVLRNYIDQIYSHQWSQIRDPSLLLSLPLMAAWHSDSLGGSFICCSSIVACHLVRTVNC